MAPDRPRRAMAPVFIALMPFVVAIVAILAGVYLKVAKVNAATADRLGRATAHLEDELADAQDERERLRRRIETLEAIVTTEGYDLDREARAAGLGDRIDPGLLDADTEADPAERPRRRVRD